MQTITDLLIKHLVVRLASDALAEPPARNRENAARPADGAKATPPYWTWFITNPRS